MMDPQTFADTGPSGLAAMSSFFDFKANSPMARLVHPIPESDFPGADLGSNSHGDDGRELPSTKAGNGFIAAADAVFAKLRQWDGSNTQPLLLAMFQVATIGLQGINEPFRAKSADYRWFGEQRKL